jgi:lauroyl/myristoyl acyltransferase
VREVDDTFRIRFHAPIFPEEAGSMEAIRERICRVLESEIGTYPYQWYIFDDFWADGEGAAAPTTESHEQGSH